MDRARLDDIMRLAVKTSAPPMVGSLRLETTFDLPPGDQDVVEKLRLNGHFAIADGRFANTDVQQKVNGLSLRARGKKVSADPPPKVVSDFTGRFILANGVLALDPLTFDIPGAVVELEGRYALRPETIAFRGNLFMDARMSETTTGWKSMLLRAADPLFRKQGRTVIPIRITGTRDAPSFGLDARRIVNNDMK